MRTLFLEIERLVYRQPIPRGGNTVLVKEMYIHIKQIKTQVHHITQVIT